MNIYPHLTGHVTMLAAINLEDGPHHLPVLMNDPLF